MCRITGYLKPPRILCRVEVADRGELVTALAALMERESGISAAAIETAVRERERYGTTAIGNGVAIPHCRIKGARDIVLSLATTARPIDYDASDGAGVELVFLIVVPEGNNLSYLKLLSRISLVCNDRALRQRLIAATGAEEIMNIIKETE